MLSSAEPCVLPLPVCFSLPPLLPSLSWDSSADLQTASPSGDTFAETPRPSQCLLAGSWKLAHPTLPLKTLKDAVFGFLFMKFLVPSKPFYLL